MLVELLLNPNGVASKGREIDATPLGLKLWPEPTQGSSCLATLGFVTESLWDSAPRIAKLVGNAQGMTPLFLRARMFRCTRSFQRAAKAESCLRSPYPLIADSWVETEKQGRRRTGRTASDSSTGWFNPGWKGRSARPPHSQVIHICFFTAALPTIPRQLPLHQSLSGSRAHAIT